MGLNVYGFAVALSGWPEVLADVTADFAYFRADVATADADLTIVLERAEPDYDALGDPDPAIITPRNAVFRDGERTVVDYFGRAASVLEGGVARIQGEDAHLVHEAAYQLILSAAGAHLDARGLPRLHALGLSAGGGAVAVLLPSGGGKSTLALRMLSHPRVKLLSEDSPLLDTRGRLHPFPLRIGVNPTDADRLPPGNVRTLERMEFHPKLVLDLDAFADRIETEPQPLRHLVVGRRSLARRAELRPAPRAQVANVLLRELIVGVGIYQGMEFILQRGARDLPGLVPAGVARTRAAVAALRGAQTWELVLGRDHDANVAALEPLLEAR